MVERTPFADSLPSAGFLALLGIFHVLPSRTAPSILPLRQSARIRLSEIPHLNAASLVPIYLYITSIGTIMHYLLELYQLSV